MQNTQLNVFFLPSSIIAAPGNVRDVYIVIDLIRATTCMTVMCDRGAKRIFAASTVQQAREAHQLYPQRLICGERHGKPLPGFDYGNSPVEFSLLDLQDQDLIMTTTNGTGALHACPPAAIRLAGSLINARAVSELALNFAQENQSHLHIVCAGEEGFFGLDDAICAGAIVQELQHLSPSLQMDESAMAAITLYETYPPDHLSEFSDAAQSVIRSGLPDDPSFCARRNVSSSVAMVVEQEADTGLLILQRAGKTPN